LLIQPHVIRTEKGENTPISGVGGSTNLSSSGLPEKNQTEKKGKYIKKVKLSLCLTD
jgi:hypothetical protein